jgi:hypothetical protein
MSKIHWVNAAQATAWEGNMGCLRQPGYRPTRRRVMQMARFKVRACGEAGKHIYRGIFVITYFLVRFLWSMAFRPIDRDSTVTCVYSAGLGGHASIKVRK